MFSYSDYKKIIKIIKEVGTGCGYKKALTRENFIIMRHDVEYSVNRAYELSKVEESMDFYSTYFFQWTNNSYNILSKKNMDMIRDMRERGHTIGLHFALSGLTDMQVIREKIQLEVRVLSEMLGFPIDVFSIHRPSKDVLRENIKFDYIINAYQDDFFTFVEEITPDKVLPVKYLSDANHIWRYGYPSWENITASPKVQILTHPFAWSKRGYDNFDNYKSLIQEMYQEMIQSVNNECKDFGEYMDWFLEKNCFQSE